MHLEFTVSVEVERIEGRLASRDEIVSEIQDALDSANPGDIEGNNGGRYEVSDWTVEETTPVKVKKAKPTPTAKNDRDVALAEAALAAVGAKEPT